MTYCKKINFLFIHIPKTGGTSVYFYLLYKYSKKEITLFSGKRNKIIPNEKFQRISLQHQVYTTLYKYQKELNIDFNNSLRIVAIVRNPYTRIISDLFHFKLIKIDSNPEEVYNKILNNYLYRTDQVNLDNHNIPQYKFVVDENNEIVKDIKILHFEKMSEEMKQCGFSDFNVHYGSLKDKGINITKEEDYLKYLNHKSIDLINKFYKKDFEIFGYSTFKVF